MFGFMKSPLNKVTKQNSVDPGFGGSTTSNPFDSDTETDPKQTVKPARRTSSEPVLVTPDMGTNPFDDDDRRGGSSAYSANPTSRSKYKNDFRESGGLENQSVQELENYAVYKSEETTKSVNNCLRIAEDIREDASKTLVTLHQQGEQIHRTHMMATEIDQDLSRGEKLLGSLGGMFSKTWKPKKTRPIKGPDGTPDSGFQNKASHSEQREREKLGITHAPKGRSRTTHSEPDSALQKVEVEKDKQDDALNDLSSILGDLKGMAIDMGSELDRQNKALDNLHVDVEELNTRVKGANQRTRRLLGK